MTTTRTHSDYSVRTLDDGGPDLGTYHATSPRIAVRAALREKGYEVKLHPSDGDKLIAKSNVPRHIASTYLAGTDRVRVITATDYLEAR